MEKVKFRGGTLLAPVPPTLISCGTLDQPNVMTVAWTGIINTKPPRLSIAVRPSRYSYNIIKERGEFAVNLTPASLVKVADFCGIYTGAKVDKFAKTGLTKEPAQKISAPIIGECPLALECRVVDILHYETHDLFLAEIVAVDVDDSIVDANGKLRLDKAGLAAFAHGEYYELGKRIGRFGFSTDKGNGNKGKNKKSNIKSSKGSRQT